VKRHGDFQIGWLLVGRIGLDLVKGEIVRLHVDLVDGFEEGPFEMQARLLDLDDCAVAQQYAALCLVDGVPASEDHCNAKENNQAEKDRKEKAAKFYIVTRHDHPPFCGQKTPYFLMPSRIRPITQAAQLPWWASNTIAEMSTSTPMTTVAQTFEDRRFVPKATSSCYIQQGVKEAASATPTAATANRRAEVSPVSISPRLERQIDS
jgi:hypothetical protein